ncbi:cell division protein FtsQ [Cupriavidus basilensis]|uniref:Cell division protein FtsQ n=1 Tax=Cupriavidus basilensis TaxID=68895 RepID=A0ABT6AWY9_9BURK|nr:cell division protein FtsQ [Cupriavidus basilensis]MDF3837009.1 cell division protein FtsQ [Cupriavidus basilensis]
MPARLSRIGRHWAVSLPGVALAVFCTIGLLAVLAEAGGVAVDTARAEARSHTTDTTGTRVLREQVQDWLEGTSAANLLAALGNGAQWLLASDLGPRVRVGCDGWLFLADELVVHPHAQENRWMRLRLVDTVSRQLSADGTRLLVAVVPDKSRVEHHRLCGLSRPGQLEPRLPDWLAKLQAQGVPTLGLAPALELGTRDTFLRTDTHWNEVGAEAAARRIAAEVAGLPLGTMPSTEYSIADGPPASKTGDLVRLAGIAGLPSRLLPAPEPVPARQVLPRHSASGDLFGETAYPRIALIGTSFSRTSNFAGYLGLHLGLAVANLAEDGGGFLGSMSAYLGSGDRRKTPPSLIIWEIPERFLDTPLSQAEAALLQGRQGGLRPQR